MAFEKNDVVLSKEHLKHMMMDLYPRVSQFRPNFYLVSCLAWLTKKTWQDSSCYKIIEEGFKRRHWHYFIYVFKMPKVIGFDPWGFPSKEICIYHSRKPNSHARFRTTSAYPFSSSYHHFLMVRKQEYFL